VKIDVLDHGHVELVYSMGGDLSVVQAARRSYAAQWRAGEDTGSDAKLIRYLLRHKHTTPFEHCVFSFDVKAPIFVFRQWHRHRTWSYNEVSARYSVLPEEYYIPETEVLSEQSKGNKQGREALPHSKAEALARFMRGSCRNSFMAYEYLLEQGVSRELARSVLPVAAYSHMSATVDLLNLMRFLVLRCDSHAQYEIRVYADAMKELVKAVAPVSMAAFEEFGL
jgi:thymidylate synthase (FAD)